MKTFLGTNVLVAAFATRGLCADVLRTVLAELVLLVSGTVLEELTRTLTEKIWVPDATAREIATFLRATASSTESAEAVPVKVRDPGDVSSWGRRCRWVPMSLSAATRISWKQLLFQASACSPPGSSGSSFGRAEAAVEHICERRGCSGMTSRRPSEPRSDDGDRRRLRVVPEAGLVR